MIITSLCLWYAQKIKNNDAYKRTSRFVTPKECCYVPSGDKWSARKQTGTDVKISEGI
jgi:hypothetical protein